MKKIALILQKSSSSWVSCKSITANLEKAYHLAFPQAEIKPFYLNEVSTSLDLIQIAQNLQSFAPDTLSFIDHKPHPLNFLTTLHEFCPDWKPELFFHVFGDFTLEAASWLQAEESLRDYPVHFFCASEKQSLLLKGLLPKNSDSLVSTLPFPVETKDYFCHENVSSQELTTDKELTIKFLYSGRISLQKNILLLVKCFGSYLSTVNPNAELWLAGPFDDLGYPYVGRVPPVGFQSSMLMRAIEMHLIPEDHHRVVYHGNLNGSQLRELYNNADVYISMSTHNDEDFGMAPAEAAACGLPLILSDWAGFSSFKNALGAEVCSTVPVELTPQGPLPNEKVCLQKMLSYSLQRDLYKREAIASELKNYCSVESVAAKLRQQCERMDHKNFHGFHYHLSQLKEVQTLKPEAPFLSGAVYSQLYRKIYDCYF